MIADAVLLQQRYDKRELAKALAGALVVLRDMECPNCGESMEAYLESEAETDREPGGRGADEVVSE